MTRFGGEVDRLLGMVDMGNRCYYICTFREYYGAVAYK